MWIFFILAVSQAASDPLLPYRDQPVVSVVVEAPAWEDASNLRPLIDLKPGDVLSSRQIQESIRRLYALGKFSAVDVFAQRERGAVALRFVLRGKKRLRKVKFRGLGAISSSDVEDRLELREGSDVGRNFLDEVRQSTLEYLKYRGYPGATVVVEGTEDTVSPYIDLRVLCKLGSPSRLRRIVFEGTPRLSPVHLRDMSGLRAGMVADEALLGRVRDDLLQHYLKRDFRWARVAPPRLVDVGNGQTDAVFGIEAGHRIRVFVVGNTVFSDSRLLALWPEGDESISSTSGRRFKEAVESAYRTAGYSQAVFRLRLLAPKERPSHRYYVLEIEEGRAMPVGGLDFIGVQVFDDALLKRQIKAALNKHVRESGLLQTLAHDASSFLFSELESRPDLLLPKRRYIASVYREVLEQLEAAYRDRGYLDVRIEGPRIREDGPVLALSVEVVEGEQVGVRSVSFSGNEVIPSADLLARALVFKEGEDEGRFRLSGGFSPGGLEDARVALVSAYRELGHLYASVDVQTSLHKDGVDIAFLVDEGPQVYLSTVLIRGHRFTREALIRSRIEAEAGDLYRLEDGVRDQRNIAELGVFSNIAVRLLEPEVAEPQKDLVFEVSERERRSVDLAFGVSTAQGPRAKIAYSHSNLLGSALTFSTSLQLNHKILWTPQYIQALGDRYAEFSFFERLEREIRIGFRTPKIYSWPLRPAFRFDVVQERENAIPYSRESLTGVVGIDLHPHRRVGLSIDPQFGVSGLSCAEQTTTGNGFSDCLNAQRRPDQAAINAGVKRAFRIGPTLRIEGRDNRFSPRKGFFAEVKGYYTIGETQDPDPVSGRFNIFSGSGDWVPFSFLRAEATLTGYLPLPRAVVALSLRGGGIYVIGQEQSSGFLTAPIDDRFFLGGNDSLRGFLDSSLVPEDVCVTRSAAAGLASNCAQGLVVPQGDTPISQGGHSYVLVKAEVRIDLTEAVSLGIFADVGNLWLQYPTLESFMPRLGVGSGLRIATPVGPLVFDLGFNPLAREENQEAIFQPHFAIGLF